jgi:hypothetical protein
MLRRSHQCRRENDQVAVTNTGRLQRRNHFGPEDDDRICLRKFGNQINDGAVTQHAV